MGDDAFVREWVMMLTNQLQCFRPVIAICIQQTLTVKYIKLNAETANKYITSLLSQMVCLDVRVGTCMLFSLHTVFLCCLL